MWVSRKRRSQKEGEKEDECGRLNERVEGEKEREREERK